MTSQTEATSPTLSDDSVAANDNIVNDSTVTDQNVTDNGIDLASIFEPYFRPDTNTIVCGALDDEKVAALAKAGVELVINLQPDDELSFDEAAAVKRAGMHYEQLPISGAADLKQLKILAFDNILRQHHGKKVAMHCGSGNRAGAAIALRAGWLRGRKMDTAMERGRSHGLTKLEEEVHNRLLVPR
ncbi:sulfur transferase domain-containing protein [Psychrobacter sp. APC 3426]|uniref:phosphatase domain-containing protein n=1 Tax=Psychrobacter sp. APC 3426 TaxID=3035177 RepID=UPI0025B29CC0|nr:sulfur transferase domain-containing protein [Psychrobacter sp. APC 3426]MDN3398647.1 sulfur transferase domain-containing protein [Psychrobacter sp. APC 3426]